MKKEIALLSTDEFTSIWQSKGLNIIPLKQNDQPWVLVQRPHNRYAMYFRQTQDEEKNEKGFKIKSENEVDRDSLFNVYN
jgi:hypothetical protein